jgi:hypothetical protein
LYFEIFWTGFLANLQQWRACASPFKALGAPARRTPSDAALLLPHVPAPVVFKFNPA